MPPPDGSVLAEHSFRVLRRAMHGYAKVFPGELAGFERDTVHTGKLKEAREQGEMARQVATAAYSNVPEAVAAVTMIREVDAAAKAVGAATGGRMINLYVCTASALLPTPCILYTIYMYISPLETHAWSHDPILPLCIYLNMNTSSTETLKKLCMVSGIDVNGPRRYHINSATWTALDQRLESVESCSVSQGEETLNFSPFPWPRGMMSIYEQSLFQSNDTDDTPIILPAP